MEEVRLKGGHVEVSVKGKPVTWGIVVGAITTLFVLMVLSYILVLGYILQWEWVGVGEAYRPRPPDPNNEGIPQDIRRMKTLWDWMQLLIVPIVIAAGTAAATFTLNQAARRREQDAEHREQEQALQRDFLRDLLEAYNTTKKVRRLLRVHHRRGQIQPAESDHDKPMEELVAAQLQFELLKEEALTRFPDAAGHSIKSNMEVVEEYLGKIVSEYEKGGNEMLYSFINRSAQQGDPEDAGKEDSRSNNEFKNGVSRPVRTVSEKVQELLKANPGNARGL